jgi:26S proteasome non-ATPase regulatory subunit 9
MEGLSVAVEGSGDAAVQLRAVALGLEGQCQALTRELEGVLAELGPSASGSLVDAEGFPRADVDVHAVLLLRHRAACLRTDLAAKSGEAEAALLRLHACGPEALAALPPLAAEGGAGGAGAGGTGAASAPRKNFYLALGVVGTVSAGGPAEAGGLLAGDVIVRWGKLGPVLDVPGQEEEGGLPTLGELGGETRAAASEKRTMGVKVLRGGKAVELKLQPGEWAGAGSLGCLVLPPTTKGP